MKVYVLAGEIYNLQNIKRLYDMRRSRYLVLLSMIVLALVLAGCAAATKSGAAQAVEGYLQALVTKNSDKVISLSCASWESQAQTEVDSFGAITAKLDSLSCQESGKNGDKTLVSCKGKIITTYNNENQEIDLSTRTYQAIQEDNQWRMCGYK
jgi:outer membrane lipoprotein-sorting protein